MTRFLRSQNFRDVLDIVGLLVGTICLAGAVLCLCVAPDILAAIADDHPVAMARQHLLAGR
ncbi:hypothetical protein [Gluconobacter oxydans]|uniref:hypothetical protein n=1 Tax=Gluconobacter oxydans TaxID=442 RepID=UPI0039EA2D2F